MRHTTAVELVILSSVALLAAASCNRDNSQSQGASATAGSAAPSRATPTPAAPPPQAAPPIAAPAPMPEEQFLEPTPETPPPGMPTYASVAELPADAYESRTRYRDGRPLTLHLKAATMISGIPCAAGIMGEVNATPDGKLTSCRLALNWRVSGLNLPKDMMIMLSESGALESVMTGRPVLLAGFPVEGRSGSYLVEFTPSPRVVPTMVILAAEHETLGIRFPRGTRLDFDPASPQHPLASARLGATATIAGTEYPAGVMIELDPRGRVTRARGVARAPDAPLRCPAATTVSIRSRAPNYPARLDWSSIPFGAVGRDPSGNPLLTDNRYVTVTLANFMPPQRDDASEEAREGRAFLDLELGRMGTNHTIAVGTYTFGALGAFDYTAFPTIRLATDPAVAQQAVLEGAERASIPRMEIELDPATAEGEVEVTVVDGDRICGNFDLRDARTRIRGEFSVSTPAPPSRPGRRL